MIDYTPYDDQALLRAIALPEGAAEAFTVLYRRYADSVYESILFIVKDPLEAEEAVQELFARIWQKRGNLTVTTNLQGYLITSCRNLVYDKMRKAKSDRGLLERLKEAVSAELEDESGKEAEELVQRQWEMLERAIRKLPPQRRKVFEMCRIQKKSYADVCAELRIALPTLKDHLGKAKKTIQDHLAAEGDSALVLLILLGMFVD